MVTETEAYKKRLTDSQFIDTLEKFEQVINEPDYAVPEPRYSYYLNRILTERGWEEDVDTRERKLKDLMKKQLGEAFLPKKATVIRDWLQGKSSQGPSDGKGHSAATAEIFATNSRAKLCFALGLTVEEAREFLSKAFGMNTFNKRDIEQRVIRYCFANRDVLEGRATKEGTTVYGIAVNLLEAFDSAEPAALDDPRAMRMYTPNNTPTYALGEQKEDDDDKLSLDEFKSHIIYDKQKYLEASITAEDCYCDYKARFIVHLLKERDPSDLRKRFSSYISSLNEKERELLKRMEAYDAYADMFSESMPDSVQFVECFNALLEEYATKKSLLVKDKIDEEIFVKNELLFYAYNHILPNNQLLRSTYGRFFLLKKENDGKMHIDSEEGSFTKRNIVNEELYARLSSLPSKNDLPKLDKLDGKFYTKRYGRNIVAFLAFYDFVYTKIMPRSNCTERARNAEEFFDQFDNLMRYKDLAWPHTRSKFDLMLINAVKVIARYPGSDPEEYFAALALKLDPESYREGNLAGEKEIELFYANEFSGADIQEKKLRILRMAREA